MNRGKKLYIIEGKDCLKHNSDTVCRKKIDAQTL